MINVIYALIAISMLVMWLLLVEDDDDGGGGTLIPAYAPNK